MRNLTHEDDADGPPLEYRMLVYGAFLVLVSLPAVVLTARALPPAMVTRWTVVPLVEVDLSIQFVPSFEAGEFDAREWLWRLLRDLAWVVFSVGYYVGLVVSALGTLTVLAGGIVGADPRAIAGSVRNALRFRVIQGLLATYVVIGLAVFVPAVLRVVAELLVAAAVGGPVVAVLGIAWLRSRATQGVVTRVLLLYPLALGLAILPVVGTALVSPTFGPWIRAASTWLAIVLLDSVLAIGGLDQWIRATFELAGVSYFGMWLGIVLVLGWILGAVTERFGDSIARIARG